MIPRRCRRCGEPIWVWPWQNAYCRDFERCIASEWTQAIESLDWNYSWPDGLTEWDGVTGLTNCSGWIEPGPIEFEQPPHDIEKCSRCMGFGSVIREDWEMGPVYEDCQRCLTTGVDPSLCPV